MLVPFEVVVDRPSVSYIWYRLAEIPAGTTAERSALVVVRHRQLVKLAQLQASNFFRVALSAGRERNLRSILTFSSVVCISQPPPFGRVQ